MDVVSSAARSRMMSSIRAANTAPEIAVRSMLHSLGFRFRLHRRDLPGRPDIVLPKHQLAVLVHGCFWHQHRGCRYAYSPKSNKSFWRKKLRGNALRDRRVLKQLEELGWRTITVWECLVRRQSNTSMLLKNLKRAVLSKATHIEFPHQ